MKKLLISFMVVLFLFATLLPVSAAEKQSCSVINGTATVDGIASAGEWDDAHANTLDRVASGDCKKVENAVVGISTVSFKAMWDSDYLYLLVNITDDQLVICENTTTSYRNDSLFLYIGENAANTVTYNETTHFICLFPYINATDYDSYTENSQTGVIINRSGVHDCTNDLYVCKVTGNATDGYTITMEIAIKLDSSVLTENGTIALDMQYNDSNSALYGSTANNRENILVWSADGTNFKGPNNTENKTLWGNATLAAAPVPPPPVTPPPTGDFTALYIIAGAMAFILVSVTVLHRKKLSVNK